MASIWMTLVVTIFCQLMGIFRLFWPVTTLVNPLINGCLWNISEHPWVFFLQSVTDHGCTHLPASCLAHKKNLALNQLWHVAFLVSCTWGWPCLSVAFHFFLPVSLLTYPVDFSFLHILSICALCFFPFHFLFFSSVANCTCPLYSAGLHFFENFKSPFGDCSRVVCIADDTFGFFFFGLTGGIEVVLSLNACFVAFVPLKVWCAL